MDKRLVIKKIPLKAFIEVLNEVYNKGAEYVDLIGTPDEHKDAVDIYVPEEYMYTEPDKEDPTLTDEDLNQLIT